MNATFDKPTDHVAISKWCIDLFWARNFYPSLDMVINDLHAKGLLPAGEYAINIDW